LKERKKQPGADVFRGFCPAYEILTTPEKKMHFDSVDPTFNDRVPTEREINDKNYFEVLGPIFEQNARFSKKQPVPTIGDLNTPQHQNEKFYNFWYTFESWRVFNYLDEDEVTGDKYTLSGFFMFISLCAEQHQHDLPTSAAETRGTWKRRT